MAKKYNFYDLKDKVCKGGVLPKDVNQFVKDYLTKEGRLDAVVTLNKKELGIHCGSIISYVESNPLNYLEIKTNFGMVEGFDKFEITKSETGECVVNKTHIKNPLLDMTKQKGITRC